MKTIFIIALTLVSYASFGQLTIDQKATILPNSTFQARVQQVLIEKAQYWRNTATSTRASVNVQMQKRKRFSNTLLTDPNAASNYKAIACIFWISITSSTTLDGNGIPTATAISDAFDPTFDHLSGVNPGDENNTEITW